MLSPFLQALLNGLVSGTILAVPAIGFTAMFALLRYGNFAVGALATVGAYGGYVANVFWGWPALAALAAAFATAGIAGLLLDRLALKPLKANGPLVIAIASLAGSLVLENIVRWFFTNDHRSFDLPIVRDMRFGDLRMGPQQLENFLLALAIMLAIYLFLAFTRLGRGDACGRRQSRSCDASRASSLTRMRADRDVFIGAGLMRASAACCSGSTPRSIR
jgi:branched-chain amino acid transport system permease protein